MTHFNHLQNPFASGRHPNNHSSQPSRRWEGPINLIKNPEFANAAEHWAVEDQNDPANCQFYPGAVFLKNNASISQPVEVERAAPYILRYHASGRGSLVQIFENGVASHVLQTLNDVKHSFVTGENTNSFYVIFTGINENQAFIEAISLEKDIPNPEELVKNGEFKYGREDWKLEGEVAIFDGICQLREGIIIQNIVGLIPGAVYRISCTTRPFQPLSYGGVFISDGNGHIQVIEFNSDRREYFYDYQIANKSVELHLEGRAIIDIVSIRRVSV